MPLDLAALAKETDVYGFCVSVQCTNGNPLQIFHGMGPPATPLVGAHRRDDIAAAHWEAMMWGADGENANPDMVLVAANHTGTVDLEILDNGKVRVVASSLPISEGPGQVIARVNSVPFTYTRGEGLPALAKIP